MFVDDTSIDIVLRGLVLSSIAAEWVIFVERVIGLRSFAKITAIDFVTTVASGSLLAVPARRRAGVPSLRRRSPSRPC